MKTLNGMLLQKIKLNPMKNPKKQEKKPLYKLPANEMYIGSDAGTDFINPKSRLVVKKPKTTDKVHPSKLLNP